ncbi:hypothetical protein [Mesorhizobium abyssinicae]|uniref:hypothetical protein n=1 Tax=Mesorhizobium abyssinicae TaxID=1209958 RepID=UPI003CF517B9
MIHHLSTGDRGLERSKSLLRFFQRQTEFIDRQRTVCSVEADNLLRFVCCVAAVDHELNGKPHPHPSLSAGEGSTSTCCGQPLVSSENSSFKLHSPRAG